MRTVVTKSHFFSIMLAISIILSLLSVMIGKTDALSYVFGTAGLITSPFQKLASSVSDMFSGISAHFGDIDALRSENASLSEENARLRTEYRKSILTNEENNELRAFLGLKKDHTELELCDAKIIARNVGLMQNFTIDKGSFHGIEKNMPVLASNGLLGMITEVGYNTSKGITLINHDVSVGVYMERTMTSAVLTGSFELYEKGLCKVINLPQETDVLVGDLVYTSGYGSIYPKDIEVGKVVSIEPDPENYTLNAIVEPSADIMLTDFVMIVKSSELLYD